MAQTLDHNNSITTVVPVEIPLFEDDLVIIQKLDDEPNDVGGLTAAELKAEFDKGSLTAQTYINETLIPRILADDLTEQARQAAESERVSNEIERVSNENARIEAELARSAAEAGRTTAEEGRVKAEQARVSAENGRVNAEAERVSAESSRVKAEQGRVSAETVRAQEETKRAAAETARVQAEQARVDTNSGIVARATAQANAAALSAGSAAGSASNAAASEEGAKSAQSAAEAAKADATVAKEDAETAKADAVAAKAAAEKARDDAQAIAGGDFVSVSDIVNDLVTNVSNKPLSAAQGVALKALMEDAISQLSVEVNENRTHWKESTETEIIPETSSTFKLSLVTVKGSVASGLVVGKTYLVEWNGVEYETVCFNSSSNTPVIGDDSSDVGTNYPFSIEDAEMGYYYVTVGSEFVHKTVTFKVTLVDTVYHQVDSRYIADAVIVKPQTFTEEQKAQARENIGAAANGGVTDYNDLENKPCYTETGAEVLPETTCDIDPKNMEGYLPDVVNVSVGNTYTVNWNGTEYTCVAQAFDMDGVATVALGDFGALTGGDSTGEPFVVIFLDSATAAMVGAGVALYALDGSTSVTLSIIGEMVHKLDEKYLPEPVVLYSDDEQYLYIRPFDGDTSKRMTTIELRTIWFSASKVLIYGETYDNQSALTTKGWLLAFGYGEVSNNGNKAGWLVNEYGTPEYYTAEFTGQSKE